MSIFLPQNRIPPQPHKYNITIEVLIWYIVKVLAFYLKTLIGITETRKPFRNFCYRTHRQYTTYPIVIKT